jgi:hypothetical protein
MGGKWYILVIVVDEGLQGVDSDEYEPLPTSTSSLEHVSAFTLEAEAPQVTTASTAAVEVSRVEGRSSLSRVLPLTFRRYIHLNKS